MEKNYYDELLNLVNKGELEILYILSPPRTLSTALEIALAEYGDGQIHEPLHRRSRSSFNEGCKIIFDRVTYLQNKSPKRHVKIVVKDISKYITPEEWRQLVELSNRFVFTIREPSRQIFSLASRYANDVNGFEDVLDYEGIISNLNKIPIEDLALNYWENLLALLRITEEHIKKVDTLGRAEKQLAIVSGSSFRYDSADSTKKLVAQLKLDVEFTKIHNDWKIGSGANFYRPSYVAKDVIEDKDLSKGAWLGRAINSTSFSPLDEAYDSPQDISIYNEKLRNYFLSNILPAYMEIYLNENNVSKPDNNIIIDERFLRSSLAKINPLEAYLLSLSVKPNNDSEKHIVQDNLMTLKNTIKDRYPYVASEFFSIAEEKLKLLI